MDKQDKSIDEGKAYLRSTSHLALRDIKGNRLRSILVGLQFLIYLPTEIISVAIWPFMSNIFYAFYSFFDGLFFVLRGAMNVIYYGFSGYLEASDEPCVPMIDEENF